MTGVREVSSVLRRASWPAIALGVMVLAFAGAQPASLVARGAGLTLALAGIVVLTGWSGQLNLHVAAIGLGWGAYTFAGLATHGVPALLALIVTPVVVIPAALAIGAIAMRFRGLELAIATLAVGLAFEQMVFANIGRWLGHAGASGTPFESSLVSVVRPGGFTGDRAYALLALVIAGLWLAGVAWFGRGRSGRTLQVVREREVVAEARGVATYGWRLGAFVLSISLAAAGGALLAGQSGAVTPESFSFTLSLQLLAVATLAGIRRVQGAVLGAALILLTQEASGVPALSWLAGDRADVIFGAGLIIALAMNGRRRAQDTDEVDVVAHAARIPARASSSPAHFADTVLRVHDVRVSFGPIAVLQGVDLRAGAGEVVGLVGGNGAGKTTLFDCITGLVTPQAGSVFFLDTDITEMSPHRRARLGLARTFQGVAVFDGLTVLDGLLVGADLRGSHEDAEVRARAMAALDVVGIAHVAERAPASLPFASLRLVEIASALVTDPALLLLDEPLAGLDAAERDVVLAAIADLRAHGRSVLIVEHDHVAVARIADRVYELRDGRMAEPVQPARAVAPRARRAPKGVPVAAR